MLIPVRCFTCGALIADKFQEYRRMVERGVDPAEALDRLGVKRYCCRRMFLSAFEPIEQVLPYYEAIYRKREGR